MAQAAKVKRTSKHIEEEFQEYLSHIVPSYEVERLISVLRSPLPSCFRINGRSPQFERIQEQVKAFTFDSEIFVKEDYVVLNPRQLMWYPTDPSSGHGGAWMINVDRHAISKAGRKYSAVKALHNFLINENTSGNISRQEAVSMLPVVLLNPQPEHVVLDMCASPGSKTGQIVEAIGFGSSGFVVANDSDEKRSHMLAHQIFRLGMNNAVITNHFGQLFPGLYDHESKKLRRAQAFDRVLCDVPCSGDGTFRKNVAMWKTWHIGSGLTLHPRQIEIAMRGASLLKNDGFMVYSTCSFNPVENEAVVAEILRRSNGSLELVGCEELLSGFITRPGMLKWDVSWQTKSQKVYNEMGAIPPLKWFQSFDEIPASLRGARRILPSMFPPKNSKALHLERCIRCIPTDQDTGGFFVAVLKKKMALPGNLEVGLPPTVVPDATPEGYQCKICKSSKHFINSCPNKLNDERETENVDAKENLLNQESREYWEKATYRRISPAFVKELREFHGIKNFHLEGLFTRSEKNSSIYFIDESIRSSCLAGPDLNIISVGTKLFTRILSPEGKVFRVLQSGLKLLLPHITKRRFEVAAFEFSFIIRKLQEGQRISFGDLPNDLKDLFSETVTGPCILIDSDSLSGHIDTRACCIHVGVASIASNTSKQELENLEISKSH